MTKTALRLGAGMLVAALGMVMLSAQNTNAAEQAEADEVIFEQARERESIRAGLIAERMARLDERFGNASRSRHPSREVAMDERDIDEVIQAHICEMAQHPERVKASSNGRPTLDDWNAVIHAMNWLTVLASPRIFHGMSRRPTREHLLKQVDIYVTYVAHDGRYMNAEFDPVPYERRGPLATRLRELAAQWTPPELPVEMAQIARELLHAEGQTAPPEGWDEYIGDPRDPFPVEDMILWPEGVPAVLRAKAEGMEENYIDVSKLKT